MADLLEGTGDPEGALALYRQALPIADLVYPRTDIRRGFVRARAASTLAAQRQFDEAERLLTEAIEIGSSARPSSVDGFRSQLKQIRSMKKSTNERPQLLNGNPGAHWFNPAATGTRP